MKIHPLAEIFPALEGAEFEALCEDIRQNGQVEKIKLYQGQIIDGRNRYNACKAIGRVPEYKDVYPKSPLEYVLSLNLKRRHLNESQRAMVADKIANLRQGRPKEDKDANLHLLSENGDKPPTREEAAKLLSVSERSVANARKVHEKGTPELQATVTSGKIPVSVASQISVLSEEKQAEIVEDFQAGNISKKDIPAKIKENLSDEAKEIIRKKDEIKNGLGARWRDVTYKIRVEVTSIQDNGGIDKLTKNWTTEYKIYWRDELRILQERLGKFADELERTINE